MGGSGRAGNVNGIRNMLRLNHLPPTLFSHLPSPIYGGAVIFARRPAQKAIRDRPLYWHLTADKVAAPKWVTPAMGWSVKGNSVVNLFFSFFRCLLLRVTLHSGSSPLAERRQEGLA